MDDAIEDRIGKRRIANDVMPAIDRRLAGENNRARIVTILDDFEQIARLLGRERLRSPVIEDEEFDPADAAQQFGVAAVTARERERGEQPWNAMVEHGEVFFAGDVPQGAGEPTFTDAARAGDNQVTTHADPFADSEFAEERPVETAGSPIVNVFDGG